MSIEYGCGSKRTLPLIMGSWEWIDLFQSESFSTGRKGKKIANVQTKKDS